MTRPRKQVLRRIIRFLLFAAVVAVLGHAGARAQHNTIAGYNEIVGEWDASQAARTNNSRTGTGSPVGRDGCVQVGESYFQTDATAGRNMWFCTVIGNPGTWINGSGVPVGVSLPATCTVGQLFFDTTGGASFGLNQCTATNTWAVIGSGGTVTSVTCGSFGASWLTCTFGGSDTVTPVLAIGAATGQTSHQVIGTCGTATSFAPCSLGIGDLPSTIVTSAASLTSTALVTGAGSQGAQTGTTKLSGGVFFPTSDSTTAIQFDEANGSTNVMTIDTTNKRVGIGTASPTVAFSVIGVGAFNTTANTQNGTSGTASCYQPFAGSVKFAACYLNGYANTGTAQTWTYTYAFNTTPVLLEGGGSCGTYNPSTTASTLTLPANASMTAETCAIVIIGP